MRRIMKCFNLFFLALGSLLLFSCFDDKGNYDYKPINEITVKGFGDTDTTYRFLYGIDTLRLNPTLVGSLDSIVSDEDCEFRWELRGNNIENTILTTTRSLELPMTFRPDSYTLYYRVKNKKTGIITSVYNSVVISTSTQVGFLVLGDRPDGTVQLDMVAFITSREDTAIIRDLLADSGVPEMRNATYVCHTGYKLPVDQIKLWVASESEAYFLDASDMTGSPSNTFNSIFYTSLNVDPDAVPIQVFPEPARGGGSGSVSGAYRGYMLSDGSIVWGNTIQGEYYGNPINRLSTTSTELFNMFPYVFYSLKYMSMIAAYDKDNERFLVTRSTGASNMISLTDRTTDLFPWNQKGTGRTLIHGNNTAKTLNSSTYGQSFALMKDGEDNYFIYAFYVNNYMAYGYPTAKKGFWTIKKELAPEIDRATRFLFSSSGTYLYYVVDNKIYCYDYSKGSERYAIVADYGEDEITWIGTDYWSENTTNRILVATWNATAGGTLQKYRESTDPNSLDWTDTGIKWEGLQKIKSVNWRNSAY